MATFREFTYPSSDGIHICWAGQWLPDEGQPRAVVQIVHGVAEHMGRYDAFARFLAGHGFAVCGEDHLGHGKTVTDGVYGYFGQKNGWWTVTEDIRQLRQRMGEQFPGVPYFLLGHSMGSFLTRTYLCRYPGTVDGAILSGTGQENALLVGAGKLLASLIARFKGPDYVSTLVNSLSLGAYNKQFKPTRTTADWISRDEGVVDQYLADPMNDNFELPDEVLAELTRTSHRHYSPGFYFGREQAKQATDSATYIREWEFVGTVDSWENGIASCQQRGKWSLGDTLEVLCPDGCSIPLHPEWIRNEAGEKVESTPHAMEKYTIPTPELPPMSLLRRKV